MLATAWLERLTRPGGPPERAGLYLYGRYDDPARYLPYAEFPRLIGEKVAHLRGAGLRAGDRVILPFETDADVIFTFLALMAMGALPLCIRPPGAVSTRASYEAFVTTLATRHGSSWILDLPSLRAYELALQRLPLAGHATASEAVTCAPHAEALAFVQFSSGSQSRPKGVPITHAILSRNLAAIAETDGRAPGDRISTWLPLFHDMGLVGGLLSGLWSGIDVHIANPTAFLADPLGWLVHLSTVRAHGCAVPNFAFELCLRRLRDQGDEDLQGARLDSLRFVYLGSEPINVDTLEELAGRLAPFGFDRACLKPCYGMAEAVLMVSCVPAAARYRVASDARGRRISVGRPHPMFEIRVRTEEGGLCAEGEIGEVELRGGSLAAGYFEDERALFNESGYYATGDLGCLEGGELFIVGRIGDRLKINAQSFFAAELEHALHRLAFVRPGRCAAVECQGRPVVLIEATRRDVPLESVAERRNQVSELLVHAVGIKVPPVDVLFVRPGQIEHTSSGKIRRPAVTDAVAAGRLQLLHPEHDPSRPTE